MDVSISQDELLATMARDFPKEYQISCLTVLNAQQARRIAELERRPQTAPEQVPDGPPRRE